MYEFVCPGCSSNYAGTTERKLFEGNVEHTWNDKDSVFNIHLNECYGVHHMFNIAKLTPSLFSDSIVGDIQNLRTSHINLVQMNTRMIDHHQNYNILLLKEVIKIKEKKPILNTSCLMVLSFDEHVVTHFISALDISRTMCISTICRKLDVLSSSLKQLLPMFFKCSRWIKLKITVHSVNI